MEGAAMISLSSILNAIGVILVGGVSVAVVLDHKAQELIESVDDAFAGSVAAAMGHISRTTVRGPMVDHYDPYFPFEVTMNPSEYGWEVVRRINVAAGVWEG